MGRPGEERSSGPLAEGEFDMGVSFWHSGKYGATGVMDQGVAAGSVLSRGPRRHSAMRRPE
jgi:hypothetical protein